MRGRPFLRVAGLFVLSTLSTFTYAGCSTDASQETSYVLVELVPAITSAQLPRAVRVVVTNDSTKALVASLCVNIKGDLGTPTASFVLRRDAGKPPTDRIAVEVTPFDLLAGQENAEPGKEFACPAMLPAAIGDAQKIALDFCASETRTLVFHVGATCCGGVGGSGGGGSCGCDPGTVCGVGISSTGKACGPSTCCGELISSTCLLDI